MLVVCCVLNNGCGDSLVGPSEKTFVQERDLTQESSEIIEKGLQKGLSVEQIQAEVLDLFNREFEKALKETGNDELLMSEHYKDIQKEIREVLSKESKGSDEAFEKAVQKYAKMYNEELILDEMLMPFRYATHVHKEVIVPDQSLKPLYKILAKIANVERPVFAPLVSIITLHYPEDLKAITSQNREEIDFVGIYPQDQICELGAPHSVLKVRRRDNDTEDNTLSAECAFLVILQTSSAESSVQTSKLIWLYCQCKWTPETKSWLIEKTKELRRGEQFL
jgi:hypothetical protein